MHRRKKCANGSLDLGSGSVRYLMREAWAQGEVRVRESWRVGAGSNGQLKPREAVERLKDRWKEDGGGESPKNTNGFFKLNRGRLCRKRRLRTSITG